MRLRKRIWRLLKWSVIVSFGLFLVTGLPSLLADTHQDRIVIRFGDQTHVYATDQLPHEIVIEGISLPNVPALPTPPAISLPPTAPPIKFAPPELLFDDQPRRLTEGPVIVINRGQDLFEVMERLGNAVGALALIALGVMIIRRDRRLTGEKNPITTK